MCECRRCVNCCAKRGRTGPTGPQGATGAQGLQGATGAQGPTGPITLVEQGSVNTNEGPQAEPAPPAPPAAPSDLVSQMQSFSTDADPLFIHEFMRSFEYKDERLNNLINSEVSAKSVPGDVTLTDSIFIIDTPGTYIIQNDQTYSNTISVAIVIAVSDVRLDLNGKTLTGSGDSQLITNAQIGVLIVSNVDNIVITNGTITQMSYGIQIGQQQFGPVLGLLNGLQINRMNLDGQVAFFPENGINPLGMDTMRVVYGSSIRIARGNVVNFLQLSNVTARNNRPPNINIDGLPTNAALSGLHVKDAKLNNLTVSNSSFTGHRGSSAIGAWFDGTQLVSLNGGQYHTWVNCSFGNQSNLGFNTLFTQDVQVSRFFFAPIPQLIVAFSGVGGCSGISYNSVTSVQTWFSIRIVNSSFNGNRTFISTAGLEANNIDGLNITNSTFNDNVNSGDIYYFSAFRFEISYIGGGFASGLVSNVSSNITVTNCKADGNRSAGGLIKGAYGGVNVLENVFNLQGDPNCPVRSAGFQVSFGSNATFTNCSANNNVVVRPGALNAKGFGFYSTINNADNTNTGYVNLRLVNCVSNSNDYAYGFSKLDTLQMSNCIGNSSKFTGLYLDKIGFTARTATGYFYVGPPVPPGQLPVITPATLIPIGQASALSSDEVPNNIVVTNSTFNGNNISEYGVFSRVETFPGPFFQSYTQVTAINNTICNWSGVTGQTICPP